MSSHDLLIPGVGCLQLCPFLEDSWYLLSWSRRPPVLPSPGGRQRHHLAWSRRPLTLPSPWGRLRDLLTWSRRPPALPSPGGLWETSLPGVGGLQLCPLLEDGWDLFAVVLPGLDVVLQLLKSLVALLRAGPVEHERRAPAHLRLRQAGRHSLVRLSLYVILSLSSH